jgi:hypothetical protein
MAKVYQTKDASIILRLSLHRDIMLLERRD